MAETMPRAEAAMLETISDTGIFQRRINQLLETEERVSKKLAEYNHLAGVIDAEEKAKQKIRDADEYHAKKVADIRRQENELTAMHDRLAAENQAASEANRREASSIVQTLEEAKANQGILKRNQAQVTQQAAELASRQGQVDAAIREYVAEKQRYSELCDRVLNFLKSLEG